MKARLNNPATTIPSLRFYQRLEWQLAAVIVVLVGITITYTGLLQQTSVNILLKRAPKQHSVLATPYNAFLSATLLVRTDKQQVGIQPETLTRQFQQQFPHSQDIFIVTDPLLNVLSAHHPNFVFIELVRQEPDKSGYSVVLSSVYDKRELFQIFQAVPAYPLGAHGMVLIVPDPTDTSRPDSMTLLSNNLNKHFKGLGIYYLAIALIIVFFVRLRLAPLRRLEHFSRQLSSENLPPPLAPAIINDELNRLINTFNDALTRLADEKARRTSLLADMAHELRTPLHNLKGRLELEAEGITVANEKSKRYTLQQINQLVQLVNDIDLMTSLDQQGLTLQKVNTNLKVFIQETLEVICHPNKFRWQINATDIMAEIDCVRMVQVFDNLLQNALRAMPDNLHIQIDISSSEDMAKISFRDNGPGVPKAALPMLFKRLFRVDKSRHQDTGGSGLGLSIVSKIIALHEGSIESFLPAEGGLGFTILLPLNK